MQKIASARPIEKFFSGVGCAAFCLAAVLVLAELAGMAASAVYHGLYLRPSVIAADLPPPRGGHPLFTLKSLLEDDLMSASPAYEGQAWADEFWKERKESWFTWGFRYEPFRVWGNAKFHGKYINVDETDAGAWRRTVNACGGRKKPAKQVWVFGGSTVFSAETPDFATLPSCLSRDLNAVGGDCTEVTNLAVPGYVVNQEAILLIQRLKAGRRPDVVVFYDGANDADTGAYSPALASAHADLFQIKTKYESVVYLPGLVEKSYAFRAARALARRVKPPVTVAVTENGSVAPLNPTKEILASKARETLDNYEANLRLVRTLGRAYGFKAHFFWQPILTYGAKNKTALEKLWSEHPLLTDEDENGALTAVYAEAELRSARKGEFIFLGRIFDQVRDPIYVDQVHLGPRGNELVADAIARRIH